VRFCGLNRATTFILFDMIAKRVLSRDDHMYKKEELESDVVGGMAEGEIFWR
jgi:hypothetical protein